MNKVLDDSHGIEKKLGYFNFLPGVIALALLASPLTLQSQTTDDNSYEKGLSASTLTSLAEFQYATLTGTNNVINVTQLPVVGPTGAITFVNLAITFAVSSTGVITFSGEPVKTPAPPVLVSAFKAGTYTAPLSLTSNGVITVSGPGITTNGSTEWSLATTAGASECTYPPSATWYDGPIASNPLEARLKAAGITSTVYSYGILGVQSCGGDSYWDSGSLLGFSQTGSTLTIVTFSYGGHTDYAVPKEEITFTLKL